MLVAVLALGLAVAACTGGGHKSDGVASLDGSKQPTSTTTAADGGQDEMQAALNWARCMRQHGIDLPDPQISGNDIAYPRPDRAVRNSAKYKAAQQACRQHQPGGGQAQRPNPEKLQRALAFARCMRRHGINIPDPQVLADGIMQDFGDNDEHHPKFKAAVRACGQGLAGGK